MFSSRYFEQRIREDGRRIEWRMLDEALAVRTQRRSQAGLWGFLRQVLAF
jgi:hypothetical protein